MYDDLNISKEVRSYYPLWLLEFREMDAVVSAACKMLETALSFVYKLVENQLIGQADEAALRDLEHFLGIQYIMDRGDRERRDFISSQFLGNGTFGVDKIKEIVGVFTKNPCNVRYAAGSAINVEITKDSNDSFILDDCVEMLNKRKPAHLKIDVTVSTPFYVAAHWGIAVSEFRCEEIA